MDTFKEFFELHKHPAVAGFLAVEIETPEQQQHQMCWEIRWTGTRTDGQCLRGRLLVSDIMLIEVRDLQAYLLELLRLIKNNILDRSQCGCRSWVDPRTTHVYQLPCSGQHETS